ncbi:MAG TPA: hypothetical protein VNU97_09950 [Rhizomicrobium sp.]|jgi:hypothetical protein|nr:hypothetical protein [Rhizomicrobium sp.]
MKLAYLLAAAVLLATPAMAAKQAPDPGAHLMHDYALSLPKAKAYDTAYLALTTAAKTDKSLQAEIEAASREHDPTIADTIAKMDHHPRVYAFFQKQGLSKMEAALLPLILMDACSGVQYPQVLQTMGDMVSQPQIDFCKANMAVLKGLHFFSGK